MGLEKLEYETLVADALLSGPGPARERKLQRWTLRYAERGITTDSKDNGILEEVFWHAMAAAGFTEGDL